MMAMYDQSLGLLRAEQARDFWRSIAQRWVVAFDHVVAHPDDPQTAEVIAEAMRVREAIPLEFNPERIDV